MTANEHDRRVTDLKRRLASLDDDCGNATPQGVAALERFESLAGVRLPEAYRAFMAAIQRLPSIIPYYGVVPPGQVPSDDRPIPLANLAEPFPFGDAWCWEDEDEPQGLVPGWPAEVPVDAGMVKHGTLTLGTDGCGLYPMLVVTGAKRGEVWSRCGEGVAPEDGGASFLDWLDHRIGALEAKQTFRRNPRKFPRPWWTYVE
jgi:hypothetical protein